MFLEHVLGTCCMVVISISPSVTGVGLLWLRFWSWEKLFTRVILAMSLKLGHAKF